MKSMSVSESKQGVGIGKNAKGYGEKTLLLACFKFLISFVYTLLTVIKEPLVLMTVGAGAEVLPVLKSYVVFPASVLFVFLFNWLSHRFRPTKIFFGFISFFLFFLVFYNFFLRPYASLMTISEEQFMALRDWRPHYSHYFVVYRDWMHALCFACIELYGQVVIFLIFWGIANDLCSKQEAKRIYPIFIMAGCLGGLLGTEVNIWMLRGKTGDSYEAYLIDYLFRVGIFGVALILLMYGVIYGKYYRSRGNVPFGKRDKRVAISFSESIQHIFSNRHLLAIAVMVISCGVVINLVDVTYKANLKTLFPTALAYQLFTAKVTRWLQIISAVISIGISGRIIRHFGWRLSSLIAPVLIVITGTLFFLTSKFRHYLAFLPSYGIQPIELIVYMGVSQSLISKVVKYVFFDTTKEIAYLSLDAETRIKGKGAVDMIGSRSGKWLSGNIHLMVLALCTTSSVLNVTHILLFFFLLIGAVWMYTVNYLGQNMQDPKNSQ